MSGETNGLEALARAYDREDASQRGEPSPWDDGADDATWRAERLACAKAGRDAYLAATAREEGCCPFCGADETEVEFINSTTWCYRRCKSCGATGPRVCAGHGGDSMDAWNRRSSLKASQEAEVVKALRQSGNYTANHEQRPSKVTFANGRVVEVTQDGRLEVSWAIPQPSPDTEVKP